MRKGISPIIAILILLLIVVAIAGSAYTYIAGYWTGLTAKGVEVTSVACSGGTSAAVTLKNIGTESINTANDFTVTRTAGGGVYAGSFSPTSMAPGATTTFTDAGCTTSGTVYVCNYRFTVTATGRSVEASVYCSG